MPVASRLCATGLLRAHASFGGAAAGISYYVVTVTNAGPTPCTLDGYPVLKFFGPSGAGGAGAGPALQVSESHAGSPASVVLLRPGGDVESLVLFSDVPVNGVGCPQVASALVYPPGSSESISVPMSLSPCGGVRVDAFGPVGSERP